MYRSLPETRTNVHTFYAVEFCNFLISGAFHVWNARKIFVWLPKNAYKFNLAEVSSLNGLYGAESAGAISNYHELTTILPWTSKPIKAIYITESAAASHFQISSWRSYWMQVLFAPLKAYDIWNFNS